MENMQKQIDSMKFLIFFANVCVFMFFQSTPVFAALGASAAPAIGTSQAGDGPHAKVSAGMTSYNGYAVSEIVDPFGTTVREYIDSNNIVFAVTWQGPNMPNLLQLLGRYADQYVLAASTPHRGRRAVAIQTDELVLRSGGRMRSFSGSAYVPSLLPRGVTSENIR